MDPLCGCNQVCGPALSGLSSGVPDPKAWDGLGELNWLDWRQQALAASWATYKAAGGT
ncbi:hypothetical protein IV102_11430 [bacterium]|nr:hypothetical protein [bacterium]